MLVGVACIYIFHYTILTVAGTVSPSLVMMETETEQRAPLHKDVKIILLGVCSAVALCLSLLGVCFCVKRSKSILSDKHMKIRVSISVNIYNIVWIMISCSLTSGYDVLVENITYINLHFWVKDGGNRLLWKAGSDLSFYIVS